MNVEDLNRSLKKCDIYLENQIISKELILQSFLAFLSGEAGKGGEQGQYYSACGIAMF